MGQLSVKTTPLSGSILDERQQVEVWSHLVVADGVELTLEPSRAGLTPEQVRAFFRAVTQAYAQIHESEEKE